MKNIIISGTPRAGKTTLANRIKRKWSFYNVIHCDSIRSTYIKLVEGTELRKYIHDSDFYTDLIIEFINDTIVNNEFPCIIDWSRLYPSIVERICSESIVISLSLGEINSSDLFQICRANEQINDFTFQESDEVLLEQCKRWTIVNERTMNERNMADIYKETLIDRSKCFDDVIKQLENLI